jgi:arylsulfatase A-like enzyme/Flp pilus assembly protein TadD
LKKDMSAVNLDDNTPIDKTDFMTESVLNRIVMKATILTAVLCLLLSCGGYKEDKPNIILITLDTTRWDYLSCYGSDQVSTPGIDSVASSGVLFAHAETTVPVTLPAHASIMTGLYPLGHGVRNNGRYRLSDTLPSLATILSSNGYMTGAVLGSFVLHSQFGLNTGFQVYDDNMTAEAAAKPGFDDVERIADDVTDAAISFVEGAESNPYFLWVHYFDPHNPYQPPEPFAGKYADNLYAGEIAYMDSCIDRLLGELGRKSENKTILTIIVGDHGEDLGDHGEMSHGAFLYESTMRVPLIMSYPKKLSGGQTFEEIVSVVDILPTVLDLLDIDSKGLDLHGESLFEITTKEVTHNRPIYIETMFPFESMGWSPLEGVVLRDWKYIRAPVEELYNITDNPAEDVNLIKSEEELAERMEAILDSLNQEHSTEYQSSSFGADKETIEKLEKLGYVTSSRKAMANLKDPKKMISPEGPKGKGIFYYHRGEFEKAVEAFSESLEDDPTNAALMNYRGLALFSMGRTKEAIRQWEKTVELRPGDLDVHLNIGMAYLTLVEADSALESYEQVLAINPFYLKALTGKGKALKLRGELDEAMEIFQRAIEVDPESSEARFLAGITHKDKGNLGIALEELDRALSLRPGMIRALRAKAMVLIDLGRPSDAAVTLKELVRQDPSRSDYLLELGHALELEGNLEESLASYRKAAEVDSGSFMAYNNIGALLDKMGEVEEAERALRKALALKADFPHAYYNLGILLKKLERKNEARLAFNKFLSLWKLDDDAKKQAQRALEEL